MLNRGYQIYRRKFDSEILLAFTIQLQENNLTHLYDILCTVQSFYQHYKTSIICQQEKDANHRPFQNLKINRVSIFDLGSRDKSDIKLREGGFLNGLQHTIFFKGGLIVLMMREKFDNLSNYALKLIDDNQKFTHFTNITTGNHRFTDNVTAK